MSWWDSVTGDEFKSKPGSSKLRPKDLDSFLSSPYRPDFKSNQKIVHRTKPSSGCAICNREAKLRNANDVEIVLQMVFNMKLKPSSSGMLCNKCFHRVRICVNVHRQLEATGEGHSLLGNGVKKKNISSNSVEIIKRKLRRSYGHSSENKPPKAEPLHALGEFNLETGTQPKNCVSPLNTLDVGETSNSASRESIHKDLEDVVIQNMEKEKTNTNLQEHEEETTCSWEINNRLPWSDAEEKKDNSRKEWVDQSPFSKCPEIDLPKLTSKAQTCPVCMKEFSNHHKTYIHFQNHYPRYLCEMCGKHFSEKQRFQSHLDLHLSIKISCPECRREYANTDALRFHIKAKHQKHQLYTCSECDERFHNYFWRKEHMLAVHGLAFSRYSCPECAESMRTRHGLFRHIEAMHRQIKTVCCAECGSSFDDKQALQRHSVSHIGEKNFVCEFCKKPLKTRKSIENHLKIHYS